MASPVERRGDRSDSAFDQGSLRLATLVQVGEPNFFAFFQPLLTITPLGVQGAFF